MRRIKDNGTSQLRNYNSFCNMDSKLCCESNKKAIANVDTRESLASDTRNTSIPFFRLSRLCSLAYLTSGGQGRKILFFFLYYILIRSFSLTRNCLHQSRSMQREMAPSRKRESRSAAALTRETNQSLFCGLFFCLKL